VAETEGSFPLGCFLTKHLPSRRALSHALKIASCSSTRHAQNERFSRSSGKHPLLDAAALQRWFRAYKQVSFLFTCSLQHRKGCLDVESPLKSPWRTAQHENAERWSRACGEREMRLMWCERVHRCFPALPRCHRRGSARFLPETEQNGQGRRSEIRMQVGSRAGGRLGRSWLSGEAFCCDGRLLSGSFCKALRPRALVCAAGRARGLPSGLSCWGAHGGAGRQPGCSGTCFKGAYNAALLSAGQVLSEGWAGLERCLNSLPERAVSLSNVQMN